MPRNMAELPQPAGRTWPLRGVAGRAGKLPVLLGDEGGRARRQHVVNPSSGPQLRSSRWSPRRDGAGRSRDEQEAGDSHHPPERAAEGRGQVVGDVLR